VLSAYGMGLADIRAMRTQAAMQPLAAKNIGALAALRERLRDQVFAELAGQGVPDDLIETAARAQLRYDGTDTPIAVAFESGSIPEMVADFEAAHRKQFGFVFDDKAIVVEANSPPVLADPSLVKGKRVLVIEDGPTLTHGEMKIGAGTVAAEQHGAKELVDPRPFLVGSLVDTFKTYPNIGTLLPAMGYGSDQMKDLAATINASDADAVVIGTPIDLGRILEIDKPHTRVTYDLAEIGSPNLAEILARFVKEHPKR